MKICHVNYYAKTGGAAVAARRLHDGLLRRRINSIFLAVEPEGDDTVIRLGTSSKRILMEIFQRMVWQSYKAAGSKNYSGHGFELFPGGLVEQIVAYRPDIVHLHSIVGEMISIREISELCRQSNIVWTFHDAWTYTGTEQYYIPGTQARYREGYLRKNNDNKGLDIDRFYWNLKKKYWSDISCKIVSPSNYLAKEVRESVLFGKHPVEVIPHGINTDFYSPSDKSRACISLGIDPGQGYIGIAAVDLRNRVKGGDLLMAFLEQAGEKISDYTILIAGSNLKLKLAANTKIKYLGALSSAQMPDFYRAVDVFFNPTRLESFGLTNLEAMACGVPVLSTDCSAIPEVVQHLKTGYLAKYECIDDYLTGLEFIISNLDRLKKNSRKRAVEYFSEANMIDRYIQIYN
jgi:glycosyltransferase involved in cell wall biosynthesis